MGGLSGASGVSVFIYIRQDLQRVSGGRRIAGDCVYHQTNQEGVSKECF